MGRTVNPLRQLDQCRPEAQETEETIFKQSLVVWTGNDEKRGACWVFLNDELWN